MTSLAPTLTSRLSSRAIGVAFAFAAAIISGIAVFVNSKGVSHFTPEHFRAHFLDASRGTIAEAAHVEAVLETSTTDPNAQGVLLESVELEETA